jgi:hypothetical protein
MSFWSSEDSVPVSQTKVAIPDEQGGTYIAGQRVDFYIPPTSKFIQPKECALSMNVKLKLPSGFDATDSNARSRLQLDEDIGAQILIRDITISTGGAGNEILEQIQNYNTLCAVKYDYETNENSKQKRALTEGATSWVPECRGTCGTTRTDGANCVSNPWFKPVAEPSENGSVTASLVNEDFYTAKVLLPLQTGLFQSERVLPIMLTEGLRISIILEDARKCFRKLDSVTENRMLALHPAFVSTNGSDGTASSASESASIADGDVLRDVFVQRTNQQTSVKNFPFVVGQRVKFVSHVGRDDGNGGFAYDEAVSTSNTRIASISHQTASGTNGLTKITFTAGGELSGSTVTRDFVLCDDLAGSLTSFSPTYEVSEAEMIIQQVDMPDGYERSLMSKMQQGGQIVYDYLTYTNYKFSQQVSDRVMNMRLPLTESRAKSILCVPTDSTVYSTLDAIDCKTTYLEVNATGANFADGSVRSNRSGLVGVWDNLTNYQFFYDGKLNPSREVNCSRISGKSIDQQPLIELEKALVMANIKPMSFLKFKNNAVIGRALSLDRGVYDTRGKDFNLQCQYQESVTNGRGSTGPSKPHLWNNYLAHLRRLTISGSSLMVER